jgi:hypothetical protein
MIASKRAVRQNQNGLSDGNGVWRSGFAACYSEMSLEKSIFAAGISDLHCKLWRNHEPARVAPVLGRALSEAAGQRAGRRLSYLYPVIMMVRFGDASRRRRWPNSPATVWRQCGGARVYRRITADCPATFRNHVSVETVVPQTALRAMAEPDFFEPCRAARWETEVKKNRPARNGKKIIYYQDTGLATKQR